MGIIITDIDLMEYANDGAAQAAYVTNSPPGAYLNTGGTITTDGIYTVHKFTSGGTMTFGKAGNAEYLIVAGGASGGRAAGAGGGAGGMRTGTSAVSIQGYSVVVGAGAASVVPDNTTGYDGSPSSFNSISCTGGGGGGRWGNVSGRSGGSGGGGGKNSGVPGSGIAGQGNRGGYPGNYSGGGGGAGGVGADRTGGVGVSSSISGSSVTYATGGIGAQNSGAPEGGSGAANTGEGGDGSEGVPSGAGGSGIVIVRVITADFSSVESLFAYSEATIKTQGSYSLKGIADNTSIGKTFTRNIA